MTADLFALDRRVAVVTGALGLLGREHVRALAERGARVVVTDRDHAACEAFAEELRAEGFDALGRGADVTDKASLEALHEAILARFDGVDVLVNNAAIDEKVEGAPGGGALEASRFENLDVEVFRRALDVNVTGVFLASQVLGRTMVARRRGSVVNVASTYGLVAPDQSLYRAKDGRQLFFKSAAYPTTKGAVLQLTRYLAAYWGDVGVRVNALCPGGVSNGQSEDFVVRYAQKTPLGRMADRADYRGAIVFLASDASSYMTGATLVVDGGFTAW
ncbi:MAG: SDR family oxidoreductase [Myxococcales bacterium]|nr:SDR family oxidoreductase [Myxococcales bacterium]MBL9107793.1 SDR family oxidoreductase [Myxococcales bacterium]